MIYTNPAENAWRIPLLKDLLLIRSNQNVLPGFNYDTVNPLIKKTSNVFQYCFNVVFLFHSFLVITVRKTTVGQFREKLT